jgi:hypothetical protein
MAHDTRRRSEPWVDTCGRTDGLERSESVLTGILWRRFRLDVLPIEARSNDGCNLSVTMMS